jgi:nitrogen regulatory protein PII
MTAHRVKPTRCDQEEHRMTGLTLHPMKEIRIIIQGEHVKFAIDLLDGIKATGYTIFHNISGKGHHGFHTAHPMFNEMDSLVMLVTVVPQEKVEPILAGLKPLFDRYTGVMFVSDVAVSRAEYFSGPSGKQ